jgi:isopenicillin-N epimerase
MSDATQIDWRRWHDQWQLPEGVTSLNHGSFGPSPLNVQAARQNWLAELESQPMEFFIRRLEEELDRAAESVGRLVGCRGDDLIFVPNATHGMNIVAANVPLEPGDEVLLTNHEYGAVRRLWGRRCSEAGAKTTLATLPCDWRDDAALVEALFERVTERTRVIVVSHVSSQTAIVFPVAEICRRAREAGILIAIDGPHAVAMVPVDVGAIGCDFYAASCHKWLSGPFGSGFLYVRREHQSDLKPVITSWGKSLSGRQPRWQDEFHWPGTFDPTPYLTLPAAIEFLEQIGLETFREQTRLLADYARKQLSTIGAEPVTSAAHCAPPMVSMHLPHVPRSDAWPGKPHPLQVALAEQGIEAPIFEWQERLHLRVSCHLYNAPADIDRLAAALPRR